AEPLLDRRQAWRRQPVFALDDRQQLRIAAGVRLHLAQLGVVARRQLDIDEHAHAGDLLLVGIFHTQDHWVHVQDVGRDSVPQAAVRGVQSEQVRTHIWRRRIVLRQQLRRLDEDEAEVVYVLLGVYRRGTHPSLQLVR